MTEQMTRVVVITALAEKTPQLGRTSLMKLCYFLQVLRRVPLGYRFSLYSYGPFDSDVLADLDSATAMGGLTCSVVSYFHTYGYKIEPGPKAQHIQARSSKFLDAHGAAIDWVVNKFGSMSASELELKSKLIYSDREAKTKKERISLSELRPRVHDVKPHFTIDQIRAAAGELVHQDVLFTNT